MKNCWIALYVLSFASPQDGNIEVYLKLMERLRVAVDFFNHNNPGSVELGHVVRKRERWMRSSPVIDFHFNILYTVKFLHISQIEIYWGKNLS